MTPVFLDTVGLLALWDRDDQWHAAAVPVYVRIVQEGRRTFATPMVLFECGNALARSPFRSKVDELRKKMMAEGLRIEPNAQEIESAWSDFA